MISCLTCSFAVHLICGISRLASLLSSPYGKFEVKAMLGWSWHIISELLMIFSRFPALNLVTISLA